MLVIEESQELRLITQTDHARLAHDIIALWTGGGFPSHPLRADILRATAQHDDGWQGVDSAPPLDPEHGWPYDFRAYPDPDRRDLWNQAINDFAETDPNVELLINRHAERIHQDRSAAPDWQQFFEGIAEQRSLLQDTSEVSPADLDKAYEYLWLADSLSLRACGAFGNSSLVWSDYEFSVTPGRIVAHPFPFAGPLTLRVACRLLPKRRYCDAVDLATSLAEARWQVMPIRIEPS